MAKPRTPTRVLEARGASRKNPQRRREEPEVDSPLGSPPSDFTPAQAAAWFEIAEIAPPGVLTGADRIAVEIGASLLAMFGADRDGFPPSKLLRLDVMLSKLGLSPADRSKIGLPIKKRSERNPFADL